MTPSDPLHRSEPSEPEAVGTISDRFEGEWKAGRRPSIEEYLRDTDPSLRPSLFRELLGVEIDYRTREGDEPRRVEYVTRFPGDSSLVEEVFDRQARAGERRERGWRESTIACTSDTVDSPAVAPALAEGEFSLLQPGARLGPYVILSLIGKGGMGEVYRARDQRLERDVAVKVVRKRYIHDEMALGRFNLEAKALAALHHPNILAIYDVGSESGISYAVTELLEGETLRDRLKRSPLPWKEAVRIGIRIAGGLRAAHAKGVIHRDLKPENVFLTTDGEVKVLDFGLARLTERARVRGGNRFDSRPGAVVGTFAYMSPEQARGESVDERSDIFSFGAVLHELLTGSAPFKGKSSAEITASIQRDEPHAGSAPARKIPKSLLSIVLQCLKKGPEQRFATATDLAEALQTFERSFERPGPFASRLRIPLAMAACVAAAIIAALLASRGPAALPGEDPDYVKGLVAFDSYKNTGKLGDLEGAIDCFTEVIKRAPGHVGAHGRLSQAYLARSSTEAAEPDDEENALDHEGKYRGLNDPGKEDQDYLKGLMHLETGTEAEINEAVSYFKKAIARQGNHAKAHASLVFALWEGSSVYWSPAKGMEEARSHAQAALRLDPTLAEAHIALALVLSRYEWKWAEAEAEFREACDRDPKSFKLHQEYGRYLMLRGRLDEARMQFKLAQAEDTYLLGSVDIDLAELAYYAGDYGASVALAAKAIEAKQTRMKARLFRAYWIRGEAQAKLGRYEEAAKDIEAACAIEEGQPEALAELCHVYVVLKRREDAENVSRKLEEWRREGKRHVSAVALAVASAALGDRDRAFGLLQKDAVDSRDEWLLYLKVDPIFKDLGLTQDPRWEELVRKIGL